MSKQNVVFILKHIIERTTVTTQDSIDRGGGVIARTLHNTHTVHTLCLIARTYHVMFTSIHLRFPHFTCDHVSQQVMITPDNVAYYAQLFTLVT